jgi:hypothetical protein
MLGVTILYSTLLIVVTYSLFKKAPTIKDNEEML